MYFVYIPQLGIKFSARHMLTFCAPLIPCCAHYAFNLHAQILREGTDGLISYNRIVYMYMIFVNKVVRLALLMC